MDSAKTLEVGTGENTLCHTLGRSMKSITSNERRYIDDIIDDGVHVILANGVYCMHVYTMLSWEHGWHILD